MKKIKILCLVIAILSVLSVNISSFAASPYDSIPRNDSTLIQQFPYYEPHYGVGLAVPDDITTTDNSYILKFYDNLVEYDATTHNVITSYSIDPGITCIDYVSTGRYWLIGANNSNRKIYFNLMSPYYTTVDFPTDRSISKILDINARHDFNSWSNALYIDITVPGTYYGSKILEYKYEFNKLTLVRECSLSSTDRGDFAKIDFSTLVGVGGYYWPTFIKKSAIDSSKTYEKFYDGCNCHGYMGPNSNNLLVVNPKKLSYGKGYYYSLVKQEYGIDVVRTPVDKVVF